MKIEKVRFNSYQNSFNCVKYIHMRSEVSNQLRGGWKLRKYVLILSQTNPILREICDKMSKCEKKT